MNILTLDGGGMRSISQIEMINYLAKKEYTTFRSFVQRYDVVVGSGSGGLLALALAAGLNYNQCRALFQDLQTELYSNPIVTTPYRYVRSYWNGNYYHSDTLKNIIKKHFPVQIIQHTMPRALIVLTDVTNKDIKVKLYDTSSCVFKIPVSNLARCCLANPQHFGPHRYQKSLYLEGGLLANNPSQIAIQNIKNIREMIGLGTGCLSANTNYKTYDEYSHNILSYQQFCTNILLNSKQIDLHTRVSSHGDTESNSKCCKFYYRRFNVPGITHIPQNANTENEIQQLEFKTQQYMNEVLN